MGFTALLLNFWVFRAGRDLRQTGIPPHDNVAGNVVMNIWQSISW
jgi:hypothetical protein